jgi:hypothetical protein
MSVRRAESSSSKRASGANSSMNRSARAESNAGGIALGEISNGVDMPVDYRK